MRLSHFCHHVSDSTETKRCIAVCVLDTDVPCVGPDNVYL